jgi:hypothetical protein
VKPTRVQILTALIRAGKLLQAATGKMRSQMQNDLVGFSSKIATGIATGRRRKRRILVVWPSTSIAQKLNKIKQNGT